MSKFYDLSHELERCSPCIYNAFYGCKHPDIVGKKFTENERKIQYHGFPDWCPLEDIE